MAWFTPWRSDAGDAAAPAPAEAQRARPAPLDVARQDAGDATKWEASRARWNLAIKPDDPAFVERKRLFDAALDPASGRSIDDTLKDHFSNYEIRKFSGWADRRREPDLYAQQKRDAEAYSTLLATPPWNQEAPRAFLAFKMTMLYFGFSVEPMKMNDLFRLPPGSGLFGLDDDGDIEADQDDLRTFVPEEMRPLRFLNRYNKRCYGADNGHMMPDSTLEMYYGLPFQPPEVQPLGHGGPDVAMRGGGLGEAKDEHFEDDSMSDGSADGSLFCSDSLLPDAPEIDVDDDSRALNIRGGSGPLEGNVQVALASFCGSTSCDISLARSFYEAIDAVLVLGERRNVKISVGLLKQNPNEWADLAAMHRGTLGDVQREQDLYNNILAAYRDTQWKSPDATLTVFACHEMHEQALVELARKGAEARTAGVPNDYSILEFYQTRPSGDETVAYLWAPETVNKSTASNLYTKWFETVLRITLAPHEGSETLGRPNVHAPRVSYTVKVGDINQSFHHKSPLPRGVWEKIVQIARDEKVEARFSLSLTRLEEQAFAQVPGYYPQGSSTAAVHDAEAVFRLAWNSVLPQERASVARIVIKRPGNDIPASFRCRNGSVDRTSPSSLDAEKRLQKWLRRKYFFTIVPQWDEHEILIQSSSGYSTYNFSINTGWAQARDSLLSSFRHAGWTISDDVHDCVFHIDQRTATGQGAKDILQENRVTWDLDLAAQDDGIKPWQEFKDALSVKRFSVTLRNKRGLDGGPGPSDPLASDDETPLWNRWGCNRPAVFKDTGNPVERLAGMRAQQQGHHHHHHHHHQQPQQAQNLGTVETPQAQVHEARHDQGILHHGVPSLGAGVDMFQSGKYYREQSFATPLSVQVGDQAPRFPINAPPLEHIRRPQGPDGIESDSMPVVSTQIMTPTEQRSLQQAFFQMRSIALNRAQQCPHKDCNAFFPVGPGKMAAFHAHLDAKHIGTHCPFCDETLFRHWSAADRQRHFLSKHSEYFTQQEDLLREALLADQTESKGNVARREEQYSFCPRCGRNHRLLNSKADRVYHDNACFPGNEATIPKGGFCTRCGNPENVVNGSGRTQQQQPHQCHAPNADPAHPAPVFCSNCALGCHLLPISYGRRHLLDCKPLASRPDSWCPWCGVDLQPSPRSLRFKHLANCVLKPAFGENPVCTESGIPSESPRDNSARLLKFGLSNLGADRRAARILVPEECPVPGCEADLTSWNAQGLYYHFLLHPENVRSKQGGLKSCPFCTCNFELRGFDLTLEQQQHFDDHINKRLRRVLADETIGTHQDRESDAVLEAFAVLKQDEFSQKNEIAYLHKENEEQSESIKHLAAENRTLRDEKAKGHCAACKEEHRRKNHQLETPSSSAQTRRAARKSRIIAASGVGAPLSKRKDDTGGQDVAGPPAKRSKTVHDGPSAMAGPDEVPDEDWGEDGEDDEYEDELALELGADEDIIDDEFDEENINDGLEDQGEGLPS